MKVSLNNIQNTNVNKNFKQNNQRYVLQNKKNIDDLFILRRQMQKLQNSKKALQEQIAKENNADNIFFYKHIRDYYIDTYIKNCQKQIEELSKTTLN